MEGNSSPKGKECSQSGEFAGLQPYSSNADFLQELAEALETEYGVVYMGVELEEVGRNINEFLRVFS